VRVIALILMATSFVNIVLEVRDNEHTERLTVTKRRESIVNVELRVPIMMGTDRCTTLVQNPRRAWKKGNGVIKDGVV
jgi:hypothetical protein